ncbi:mismatch-specific DNA-glycosylase [Pseudoclavibacter alba]|uniref:mismatch-specific DNA-glycosylase n=1 Tax=Pseudoclavibacter albus TaxID=272241 RepID=UPI0019D17F34|nr:mismatch-specific DNA-glycosylase [Pseudoclavibacter alba]MBN6777571.1 mismatch-specific DNA-glycosylase [Pseudoclavibacter alba]
MTFPRRSPLNGRKPTRDELAQFANATIDDVIANDTKILVVGINPGLWTAAVNAPFAHPGNRFWPSLEASGLMPYRVDATRGLSDDDLAVFTGRGFSLTNLVSRATARADELATAELKEGRQHLEQLAEQLQPKVIAIVGITAYRAAFDEKKAVMGKQERMIAGAEVWVLPQPSGLNAHAPLPVLAEWWRQVGEAVGMEPSARQTVTSG